MDFKILCWIMRRSVTICSYILQFLMYHDLKTVRRHILNWFIFQKKIMIVFREIIIFVITSAAAYIAKNNNNLGKL